MRPPALASWLLRRLVADDVIAGDLLEQYRVGRSRRWYWQQVVVAIVIRIRSDIGGHKLMMLRGLLVGWTFYVLFSYPVIWLGRAVNHEIARVLPSSALWRFFGTVLPSDFLVWVACVASGWIVARLHPAHAAAGVFVYATSVLIFEYAVIVTGLLQHESPEPIPLWAMSIGVFLAVIRPLSILIGGVLAAGERRALEGGTT
jgi:hypothetical protein